MLIQEVRDLSETSSQVMLLLLMIWGPYFKNGIECEEGTLKNSTQEERNERGLDRHVLCCVLSHSVVSDSL